MASVRLLALALLGAAAAEKASPIGKVLEMISDLQAKVIGEGEASHAVFAEFSEWCEDRARELGFEIKTAEAEVAELKASVEKETANIEMFSAKVEDLAGELAKDTADLKAATTIREKEQADFEAEEGELMEIVDTLKRAISILEREMAKAGGAALVQLKNTASVTQALSVMVRASLLSSTDASKLSGLLQTMNSDDDDSGAPAASTYEGHSGAPVHTPVPAWARDGPGLRPAARPERRLLAPAGESRPWRWSSVGLERSLRFRAAAASSRSLAPLEKPGVAASKDLASSETANIGIEIPMECFIALPEADTYALRTIIADVLRAQLVTENLSTVEVTAPSVLRMLRTNSSSGSLRVAVEPRIIFRASVRYANASISAVESSLSSSYLGANIVVAAEEELPGFRSACGGGPRALSVVPRGLSLADLMPAHRDDFERVDDSSASAPGGSWPRWLPPALVASGGTVWVVAALHFGRSLLKERLGAATPHKPQLCPDGRAEPDRHDVDAIVVPGGGLMPCGEAPPWTEERLLEARALFEEEQIARTFGKPRLVAPTIVTHNAWNPTAPNRGNYFGSGETCEADVCARYLHERCGVPKQAVWPDILSFTLIGNAYFCRMMFVEARDMRHVAVVTNRFQMKRAKAVFGKIFSLPPLPHGREDWYTLSFREAADAGLEPEELAALREQERLALRNFEALQDRFTTVEAVHRFLVGVFDDTSSQLASASARCA
ncbi:unnamed protein product [Prorocentrum cordatum]|nr:unnamed protein product [Polarella glacialis]